MADRSRDLYDIILKLQALSTPEPDTSSDVVDVFQTPNGDTITLGDGGAAAILNRGHSGTYLWSNATSLWNKAMWS